MSGLGLFDKLKLGLAKTRRAFSDRVEMVLRRRRIDEDVFEELEDALLSADVGLDTTGFLLDRLTKEARREKLETADQLIPVLRREIHAIVAARTDSVKSVSDSMTSLYYDQNGLTVVLVVGVNGVGKTTTIGKLAYALKQEGKRVMVAAGDTFRAAAIEQLSVWADRAGVDIIKQTTGSDAAAVIFDAIEAAKARRADVLLCDTAGRLQNKAHLMDELEKIYRVIAREVPGAPHETLLVLDATTGQNAIIQAKLFQDVAKVTGIVLTKLDGTAKGGVVIAIGKELKIPVKWVGLGERLEDLQPFSADDFATALFDSLS